MSAQTFARSFRNVFSWEKRYIDSLILLTENVTLILKIKILTNCTAKFCCRYGNFQNKEAVTGGALKSFTKFTGKHLEQTLFFHKVAVKKLQASALQLYWKKTPTQVSSCELCKMFWNTFFASDSFSKYESFYMIAAIRSRLIKSCSENVWEISRSISLSDFRKSLFREYKIKLHKNENRW